MITTTSPTAGMTLTARSDADGRVTAALCLDLNDKAIDLVRVACRDLFDRIGPILDPQVEAEQPGEPKGVRPPASDVNARMQKQQDELRDLEQEIRWMTKRVAL